MNAPRPVLRTGEICETCAFARIDTENGIFRCLMVAGDEKEETQWIEGFCHFGGLCKCQLWTNVFDEAAHAAITQGK